VNKCGLNLECSNCVISETCSIAAQGTNESAQHSQQHAKDCNHHEQSLGEFASDCGDDEAEGVQTQSGEAPNQQANDKITPKCHKCIALCPSVIAPGSDRCLGLFKPA
jgi:hypothetical protein